MKLFERSAGVLDGDHSGYIHEYIACRINAMIEVLELPVEMLTAADPDAIRNKLFELSDDHEHWETTESRIVWLEKVINTLCENGEMISRVENLTREKLQAFMSIAESA